MINQGFAQGIPYGPGIMTSSTGTHALSATTTWCAYCFTVIDAKTLKNFGLYLSSVTATPPATLTAELYLANTAVLNSPPTGSALDSATISSPAAGWVEWTNWTGYALQAGTRYCIVIKGTDTNYVTVRLLGGCARQEYGTVGPGWTRLNTSNSGTAWSTNGSPYSCWYVEFTDGTIYGSAATNSGITNVSGTNMGGNMFRSPPNAIANCIGVYANVAVSSPSQNMVFRIYQDGILIGETIPIPKAWVSNGIIASLFSAPVRLQPNKITHALLSPVASMTGNYQIQNVIYHTAAKFTQFLPYNGTCVGGTGSISSFTPVATNTILCIGLLLDNNAPFLSAPLNRRKFNNQR